MARWAGTKATADAVPPVPAHCKSFQGFQRLEAEHCSLQMLVQQYNKVKLSVHLYLEKVKNKLSIIINSLWKQHKNECVH